MAGSATGDDGKGMGDNEPQSKSQRLLRVDQIYRKKDRQIHFVKTPKTNMQAKYERFSKTALVVRRIISKQGMVASIEIDVKSALLKEVLLDIYKDTEGMKLHKTPPIITPEQLFIAMPGLQKRLDEERAKDTPNSALVVDLEVAQQCICEDFGSTMQTLASLSAVGETTFELLWVLFTPKTIVFTKHNVLHEPYALRILYASYEQRDDGSTEFQIKCNLVRHDGQDFGWAIEYLSIPSFEGTRRIDALPVFPMVYHSEAEATRASLLERGRTYITLLGSECREYRGYALKEESGEIIRFYTQGRIMIDPAAYRQHTPGAELLKPWVPYTTGVDKMSDEDLMLCTYSQLGFCLSKKTWGAFAISNLEPVNWNDEAFKKLVIEPQRRSLIHALVKSHRSDGVDFDDIVQQKGRGLIGLLSGNPGVGKTLTAEAVSDVTRRPLYMISAGELGTDVDGVDRQLQTVLEITRRWGCVLLIDEADVFLNVRDMRDLSRNAIVSIFLRRLEYYQGILILTTNRRSVIDPAFQSRIHFTINYPDLDRNGRVSIWKNFTQGVAPGPGKPRLENADIEILAEYELNGRQIKNTVSCALSLAREKNVPLTIDHIKMVLEILADKEGLE